MGGLMVKKKVGSREVGVHGPTETGIPSESMGLGATSANQKSHFIPGKYVWNVSTFMILL